MDTPYTVCAAILAVVSDAFETAVVPVGIQTVGVGAIATDTCCNGLLVVAPERVFRIDMQAGFPGEAGADGNCGDLIGVDVLVYAARCIPVIEAGLSAPRAPSITEQETAFAAVLRDAAIIWNAVTSAAMLGDDEEWDRANVVQTYTGPLGDCLASETRFTVGIGKDEWCLM